jgi:hypothetical protein
VARAQLTAATAARAAHQLGRRGLCAQRAGWAGWACWEGRLGHGQRKGLASVRGRGPISAEGFVKTSSVGVCSP